jgi:hypothetical protein
MLKCSHYMTKISVANSNKKKGIDSSFVNQLGNETINSETINTNQLENNNTNTISEQAKSPTQIVKSISYCIKFPCEAKIVFLAAFGFLMMVVISTNLMYLFFVTFLGMNDIVACTTAGSIAVVSLCSFFAA